MSKYYGDPDQKEYFWNKTYWIDKNGVKHELKDMSANHIKNVIKMIFNNGYFPFYVDSPLEIAINEELERRENK